jgi:hypothetical protein
MAMVMTAVPERELKVRVTVVERTFGALLVLLLTAAAGLVDSG